MSIFGWGNKSNYYNDLLNRYAYLSSMYHHLRYKYKKEYEVFQVMARDGPHPWPGIKVHTPLSDKIYNVLIDPNFQDMIIKGRIDGIKIYKKHSHKQVTFYISFHSIAGYKELLTIFRKHKIDIKPDLHHDKYGNVLLNKMHIAEDIFVRYSTDFYGEKNDPPQADDSKWRSAADSDHPQIWAVSKEYLLKNLYKLNYESHSHIYTFLTLERYGIEVPIPRVILSLGYNYYRKTILKVYLMDDDRVVYYDPYNEEHTKYIIENPKQALENFLI